MALKPKQHQFLIALLEENTVEKAWKRVGISNTTAYKYMDDPEFQKELTRARRKAVDGISNRLRNLGGAAIDTLKDNLSNEESTPATRNSTAKIILEFIYRSHEIESVTERIDQLEKTIEAHQTKGE